MVGMKSVSMTGSPDIRVFEDDGRLCVSTFDEYGDAVAALAIPFYNLLCDDEQTALREFVDSVDKELICSLDSNEKNPADLTNPLILPDYVAGNICYILSLPDDGDRVALFTKFLMLISLNKYGFWNRGNVDFFYAHRYRVESAISGNSPGSYHTMEEYMKRLGGYNSEMEICGAAAEVDWFLTEILSLWISASDVKFADVLDWRNLDEDVKFSPIKRKVLFSHPSLIRYIKDDIVKPLEDTQGGYDIAFYMDEFFTDDFGKELLSLSSNDYSLYCDTIYLVSAIGTSTTVANFFERFPVKGAEIVSRRELAQIIVGNTKGLDSHIQAIAHSHDYIIYRIVYALLDYDDDSFIEVLENIPFHDLTSQIMPRSSSYPFPHPIDVVVEFAREGKSMPFSLFAAIHGLT